MSLVPYVAKSVNPYAISRAIPALRASMPAVVRWAAPSRKRRRIDYSAIHSTYQTLARMNRAQRTIRRAWKKSSRARARARARRSVGQRVGTSSTKRIALGTGDAASQLNRPDRFLNTQQVPFPFEGTTPENRERNLINLRGIKLCFEFSAGQELLIGGAYRDRQATINLAVVSNKKQSASGVFDNTHFFRALDGLHRAEDFDTVSRSIDFHCRPINSDEFNVHAHHRTVIAGEAVESIPTVRRIMKYIPIKRQIRFDVSGVPDTRIWVVWWVALAGEDQTASFNNIYKYQWSMCTYFKDPRN